MDDRDLYWRQRTPSRREKEEPLFYSSNVKSVRSWSANYEPGEGHFGKGPKNYRRPDLRILEDINEDLTRSPYVDATDISVEVNMGVVTLSGRVRERRAKHIAEEIAERVTGVREVRNQIRVGHLIKKSEDANVSNQE